MVKDHDVTDLFYMYSIDVGFECHSGQDFLSATAAALRQ
jgi:hypothetical protein